MLKHTPVLIVGMARSGTTLVSHILGSLPGVHIEVEPHALWKSGNFKYFNDEQYDITDTIVKNIQQKFSENIGEKILVEKSPINSLRPHLVHAVFPDAKIIYIEREPVRCIYSNYQRSVKKDSFKLSIILKKYFVYTGSKDLSGAISQRKLFQQISISDLPAFIRYTAYMFYLRQVSGHLPFGPKLKNFASHVKEKGLLDYHVSVYKKSQICKEKYKELYKENMQVFSMEKIMEGDDEINNMISFSGIEMPDGWIHEIRKTFDTERIEASEKSSEMDKEILRLIALNG